MLFKLQSAIALFTCGCLASVASSPSNIGFVVTTGQTTVDGAVVRGNSTLFQGNLVHAGDATSDLMFAGGSNLLLQPGAKARVFRDYDVLEQGTATQRGSHLLLVNGLRVTSLATQGVVTVQMRDAAHLSVQAQDGAAEVRNPNGALVARLEPGKALSLALQAAPAQGQEAAPTAQAAPPSGTQITIHGILRKDHPGRYGHFLLTDLATKVTYELQGEGLDDLVGASVEATGSTFEAAAAPGATQVVSISDVHQMPLSEIQQEVPGVSPATPPPPPTTTTPPAAPPTPSGEPIPSTAGPEVGATPEAKAPPEPTSQPAEEASVPQPPPIAQHSATAKILLITALAGGAVVGVALGLGGGKSSTVSPE
jgi:hypothetical protein